MLDVMAKRTNANANLRAGELFNDTPLSDAGRAQQWLSDRLRLSEMGEPKTEVVVLTPALAQLLLGKNAENRAIRPLRLANYVADMKAGLWALNGESLKVSAEGLLNDGQHRCQAVISSGCSVRTMITFGVSRETRTTLDQGAVRSPGDYLGMIGVAYSNETAAAAALLWQYQTRGRVSYQTVHRPTKQQIQETYASHPRLTDSVAFVPRKGSVMSGGASVLAFCHYIFRRIDREASDYFISKLVKGDGLGSSDPIYVCRERLHANKKMKVDEKVEIIFRAWNAARLSKRIKKLQVMGGDLPALED